MREHRIFLDQRLDDDQLADGVDEAVELPRVDLDRGVLVAARRLAVAASASALSSLGFALSAVEPASTTTRARLGAAIGALGLAGDQRVDRRR